MLIETERLALKPFCMEYAEEFTETLSDPRIFTYLPESVPSLKDIQEVIEWFMKRDRENIESGFVGTNLCIHLKDSKEIVGWCGIQPFEPEPDKKEIFYGLTPKHWNKGILTEAAEAVLHYAFTCLEIKQVVAGVKPENIPSKRVLEKIGMNYIKTIDSVPEGSEFYLGELYYSITKEEFLNQR